MVLGKVDDDDDDDDETNKSSSDLRFLTMMMKSKVNRKISFNGHNVTFKVKPSWFTSLK